MSSFWDREILDPQYESFMASDAVRFYMNEAVSGSPYVWPIEWLKSVAGTKYPLALSIGCGGGALERSLIKLDLCERVEAFDASLASLHIARTEARREGMEERISYFAADFNKVSLPRNRYDAVFFHQSFHHVSHVERLYLQVWRALKPGGLLYLDEYVGPSRFEWNEEKMVPIQRVFDLLPATVRKLERVPEPIAMDDYSEAIRSSDIVPYLEKAFVVTHERPYGCGILSTLFPHIDWANAPEDLLPQLISADAAYTREHGSFLTIFLARPKRRPLAALVRYVVDPKLRRIGLELRRLAARLLGRPLPPY